MARSAQMLEDSRKMGMETGNFASVGSNRSCHDSDVLCGLDELNGGVTIDHLNGDNYTPHGNIDLQDSQFLISANRLVMEML